MKCVGGIPNFYSGNGFADFKIISCVCRLDSNNQTHGGNDSFKILYVDTTISLPKTRRHFYASKIANMVNKQNFEVIC